MELICISVMGVPFLDRVGLIKSRPVKRSALQARVHTSGLKGFRRVGDVLLKQGRVGRGESIVWGPFLQRTKPVGDVFPGQKSGYQQRQLSIPSFPSFLMLQITCVSLLGFTRQYHVWKKAPGLTLRTRLSSLLCHIEPQEIYGLLTFPNSVSGS